MWPTSGVATLIGRRLRWSARPPPHELRHTAASLTIAASATVKSLQRMLGHASATLTLDRWGHLSADELDDVAAGRDAMWDADVVPSPIRPCSSTTVRSPKMRADLRFCWVPPAGSEPATHGLEGTPGGSVVSRENSDSASELRKRMATTCDV